MVGDRNTVWAVLNAFLRDCESRVANGELAQNTLEQHRDTVMTPFCRRWGSMTVRDLRPQHVNEWLSKMRQPRWNAKLNRKVKWTDATVSIARKCLKRAFIWATEESGLISKNPLDRVGKKPRRVRARRHRGSRTAITEAEHQLLLGQAMKRSHKDFAYLLMLLLGTGARPAEMYLATAEEWDEEKMAFVIKATPENHGRYKLAHLGEDRIVYVPDSLVPLVKKLMANYPTGPIFRSGSGQPWNRSTLCARIKCSKAAVNNRAGQQGSEGIRKEVTCYSYRHGFVTRWLTARGDVKEVMHLCEILNTSLEMLRRHYSHLLEQTQSLRDSLNHFDQAAAVRPRSDAVRGPTSAA